MSLRIIKEQVQNKSKILETPQMDFVVFDEPDVITTSGDKDWKKDTELDEI